MAAQVNTRFVLILSAVLVLLIGGVVGVAAFVMAGSAESDVKQGDLYFADGEYKLAVVSYGSAVNKRPGDVALLDKFLGALREVEVSTSADARKYLGQISNALRIAAETSGDPQRLEAFYQQMLDWSQQLGPGFINQLHAAADQRLDIDPNNAVARKYRGIASVRRMTADTSAQDRDQAREDLEFALEQRPNDPETLFHLAAWKLAEAGRIDQPGDMPGDRPEEAQKLKDEALALAAKLLEQDAENPDRQMKVVQIMLDRQFADPETGVSTHIGSVRGVVDDLEARLLQDPSDRQLVLGLASVLQRVDREPVEREGLPAVTDGTLRAANLLRTAAEARPNDIRYATTLGEMYARLGQTDEALAQFDAVRRMGITGKVVDALVADNLQLSAAYLAAKLLLQDAETAQGEQRQALIDQARTRLADIESLAAQSALSDEIRGRILRSEGKTAEALIHIDRALDKKGGRDLQLILLSADLRRQQDAPGSAMERLEQALAMAPGAYQIRLQLAQLQMQSGRTDAARRNLQMVLEQDPQNAAARSLQATMLLQEGRADEALAMYEQMPEGDQPQVERAKILALAATGRSDEARQLARQVFDRDRSDLTNAAMLMRFTEDDAARLAILDEAQQGGADAQRVEIIRQRLALRDEAQGMSREEMVARQMEIYEPVMQGSDPLDRALAEARLYASAGDSEKAQQAIDAARELAPNDPRVIELRFERAVQDQDWAAARQIVDLAATQDADLARGDFYRGRLAMAQGKHEEAVFALRRALEARPVYGAGWRLLGQALLATQDVERAAEAFQRAVAQVPNDVAALLGLTQAHLSTGQHQRALEVMRQVVRLRPNDAIVQRYIALEQQFGDRARAQAMRQQIAQQKPEDYDNRRALAVLQARAGQVQEAMATIEALVAELGQTAENVVALAAVHQQAGEIAEGRAVIERYIGSRGGEVTADDYRMLAAYELGNDDLQAAIAAYEKARPLEDAKEMPVTREMADLLFSRRMTEPAVQLYREVLAATPDDQRVRLRLSEALMRLGRGEEAQALLADADADRVESLVLRAMLARQRDDAAEALRLLNQAIKQEPSRADLYFQRAMVLTGMEGRERAAVSDLNSTLSHDPRHTGARLLLVRQLMQDGSLDQAARELRTILDYDPANTPARTQLISLRVQDGDITGARLLAQQGAQVAPEDPTWPPLVARFAAEQGDRDAAIVAWRRAVEMNPGAAEVSSLASALLSAGRASEALPLFREHVGLVNAQPVLQGFHGRALLAAGQGDAGRQVLSNALANAQTVQQVLAVASQLNAAMPAAEALSLLGSASAGRPALAPAFELAMAQLELAQRQFAEAAARLAALEPALTPEHPLRPQVEQMLALSLYSDQRFDQARQVYDRILARDPDNVGALNNVAFMLAADLKDPQAALPLAKRAAELRPRDARVLDTLGLAQLRLGDLAAARDTLNRSVEIEELPANTLHLAEALAADGLTNRARTLFQRALELGQQQDEQDVVDRARAGLEKLDAPQP